MPSKIKFEVVIGNKATIESTLETYLSSKFAHSLMVLGFYFDTTTSQYHVLVRFREI